MWLKGRTKCEKKMMKAEVAVPRSPSASEYTMMIGGRPKLYDLNKNLTNFEIDFSVEADDPSHVFQVSVMAQDQLDKTDSSSIPFRPAEGRISGKVTNDNSIYQNYFLVIRTDAGENRPVVIRTSTKILPTTALPPTTTDEEQQQPEPVCSTPWHKTVWFKYLPYIGCALVALVIIYFLVNRSKPKYKDPSYYPLMDNDVASEVSSVASSLSRVPDMNDLLPDQI